MYDDSRGHGGEQRQNRCRICQAKQFGSAGRPGQAQLFPQLARETTDALDRNRRQFQIAQIGGWLANQADRQMRQFFGYKSIQRAGDFSSHTLNTCCFLCKKSTIYNNIYHYETQSDRLLSDQISSRPHTDTTAFYLNFNSNSYTENEPESRSERIVLSSFSAAFCHVNNFDLSSPRAR